MEKFITYLKRTAKNKVYALVLALAGTWSLAESGDGTALVFLLFMAVPLFFAKEEWV